jgi:deazaflavin-dependent oxidoreductase (nitroreductase family)
VREADRRCSTPAAPRPGAQEVGCRQRSAVYVDGRYVPERARNLLVNSPRRAKMLSAMQLPLFTILPPAGFGVLTTRGRRTGRTRRRCVRAIRAGDKAYLVAIGGRRSGWLKNALANREVRLRIRGGRFTGVVREPQDEAERTAAEETYCEAVNPFDYGECLMHRRGIPTRRKIIELHREWVDGGSSLVLELRR